MAVISLPGLLVDGRQADWIHLNRDVSDMSVGAVIVDGGRNRLCVASNVTRTTFSSCCDLFLLHNHKLKQQKQAVKLH